MEKREDFRTGDFCPFCDGQMVRDPQNGLDYCPWCGYEKKWD